MTTSVDEARQSLRTATSSHNALRCIRMAQPVHDSILAKAAEQNSITTACRSGCDYCCYLRVGAKAHEILLIAEHIKNQWPKTDYDHFVKRLAAANQQVRELTNTQQMARNICCPLLVSHTCTVYSIRPFGCRRHHSFSVDHCKYSFEQPQDLFSRGYDSQLLLGVSDKFRHSLHSMYADYGYDTTEYELITGLYEAITSDKPLKRWFKKQAAFKHVQKE